MTDAREMLRNWEYQHRARRQCSPATERQAPAGTGGEGVPHALPAPNQETEE